MVRFVWSDACLRHEPGAEVWVGTRTPATEVPERAIAIREALLEVGAREVPAVTHDDRRPRRTRPAPVEFLRTAWDDGRRPLLRRVVPCLRAIELWRTRAATDAVRRGRTLAYDTMTLSARHGRQRAAVDARHRRRPCHGWRLVAYACCRPPDHHPVALRRLLLLNNTAVARPNYSRAWRPVAAVVTSTRITATGRRAVPRLGDVLGVGARRPGRRLVPALPRLRCRATLRASPRRLRPAPERRLARSSPRGSRVRRFRPRTRRRTRLRRRRW
jgi:hypothetical protein